MVVCKILTGATFVHALKACHYQFFIRCLHCCTCAGTAVPTAVVACSCENNKFLFCRRFNFIGLVKPGISTLKCANIAVIDRLDLQGRMYLWIKYLDKLLARSWKVVKLRYGPCMHMCNRLPLGWWSCTTCRGLQLFWTSSVAYLVRPYFSVSWFKSGSPEWQELWRVAELRCYPCKYGYIYMCNRNLNAGDYVRRVEGLSLFSGFSCERLQVYTCRLSWQPNMTGASKIDILLDLHLHACDF